MENKKPKKEQMLMKRRQMKKMKDTDKMMGMHKTGKDMMMKGMVRGY